MTITREEHQQLLLDSLVEQERLEIEKKAFMADWRERYNDVRGQVLRYRRKLTGDDTQMELE